MNATRPNLYSHLVLLGSVLLVLELGLGVAGAANATWNNNGTDFNTGANWTGGTGAGGIPGTGDTALFAGNENSGGKQPNLSGSLTILGVDFSTVSTMNWNLTASSGQLLAVTGTSQGIGASAVYGANTAGSNTINAPLIFGAAAASSQYILQASGGTLTLAGAISATNAITLNMTSVSGTTDVINLNGQISGAGITLTLGKGAITLGGTSNNYSGTTNAGDGTVGDSTITLNNNSVFGTSTVNFGGAVQAAASLSGANAISNNVTLNSSATVFQGSNSIELSGGVSANGHTTTNNISGAGTLKISGNVTLAGTPVFQGSGATIISGNISGASGNGITYSGTNTLTLSGANTFTGATTISNGAVSVASVNSVSGGSANSSLGAPNSATNGRINLGSSTATGTLVYTGSGETTDRAIRLVGNGTIENDGSGALDFTTAPLTAQSASSVLTLQGSNTGNNTIAGVVGNLSGSVTTGVTKAGAGTWVLSNVNTYTGATTVGGGKLVVASAGSLTSGSAVSVNGGTLTVNGVVGGTVSLGSGGTLSGAGNGTTTGVMGALTVSGGGIINTVDGAIGKLGGSTLTLNTGGGNAVLDLDLGSSFTADELIFSGAATLNNNFTVNVTGITGAGTGTYTIMQAASGLVSGDFTSGVLSGTVSGDAMSFQLSGNTLQLVVTGVAGSPNYYFTGTNSNSFTDAGNYFTAATGGSQQSTALSSTSNVYLNANSAVNTPDTLTGTVTVNTLNFVSSGASLAGSGTVTLAAGSGTGVTDSATGGTTETLSPQVALGVSQGWTVSNSTNTLTVAGGVTGTSGQTLTLNGPGTFKFSSGSSSGAYNTAVSSGASLLLSNGTTGSALGTGTLTVQKGAFFGGAGRAAGLTAFNIGSGGSGIAQVQVGAGGSDTTGKLVLTAGGASTISNANLTFNLNSSVAGQANELDLGSTSITFSSTTLTLNLVGTSIIAPGTAYALITDSNGFAGLNVTQGQDGMITSGLSIGSNAYFGASLGNGGFTTGFYSNTFLFVTNNGTEIDVEVVPEPSTWAMIISGMAILLFWQKRRARRQ